MSPDPDDDPEPADAFAALGNETRVAILEALVDARRESPRAPALSFSELRERVGVEDSGRFNYHLGALRGLFVHQTPAGYELTYAGTEVTAAILAGTYGAREELEPVELDAACPDCGRTLAMSYETGLLRVSCPEDHATVETWLPPGAVEDRSIQEVLALGMRRTQQFVELAVTGACPHCLGHMDTGLVGPDAVQSAGLPVDVEFHAFESTCGRCGTHFLVPVGVRLVRHPDVVAFYREHGVDVRSRPYWEFDFAAGDEQLTVLERDPLRVQVDVELEGDVLAVTVGADGAVQESERRA